MAFVSAIIYWLLTCIYTPAKPPPPPVVKGTQWRVVVKGKGRETQELLIVADTDGLAVREVMKMKIPYTSIKSMERVEC